MNDVSIEQGARIYNDVGFGRDISETEIDYSERSEVSVLLPCEFGEGVKIVLTREFVKKLYMGFLENDYPPSSGGFDQETDKMLYGMFVFQEFATGSSPDPDLLENLLNERGYRGQAFINYAYKYIEELNEKYKDCIYNPGSQIVDDVLAGNFEYPKFD